MTMTLISQKSILSDTELKAYKLINRLIYRNLLRDVNASIIYHSLKMIQLRKKFKKKNIDNQKSYEFEFNAEKKMILDQIELYKIYNEKLKRSDKVQTKDQLIDILEQIEKNIFDIEEQLIILEKINTSFQGFKNAQSLMLKYLKSNILNTQFIYEILQRNHKIYGVLGMDQNLAEKEKHKLRQEIDVLYTNYHENEKNLTKNKENENNENKDYRNLNGDKKRTSIKLNKKKNTLYILNERNERNIHSDVFNWEKFFLPLSAQNIIGKKRKLKRLSNASVSKIKRGNGSGVWSTNSTIMGDGRRIFPEDLYARELQKYNVDQNDFSQYFYSVFFQRNPHHHHHHSFINDEKTFIQNVIMRHSPKTPSSIKVMKNIKNKLDKYLKKYMSSSSDSESNSMDENKEVDNVD